METALGVVAQLLLVMTLSLVTPLGLAGWITGGLYTVALCGTLMLAMRRSGARSLGPADRVTLARALLVGCVTVLVVNSIWHPAPVALLVTLAAVALFGDFLDGQIARRTGTASKVGARFDMEVDAFLILVLSVFVASYLGPWVVAIGLMRYVFVAASRVLPWLTAPLPPSMARKTVAALQGILLVVAASGVLPHLLNLLVALGALGALVWSFGRDVVWLYHADHS